MMRMSSVSPSASYCLMRSGSQPRSRANHSLVTRPLPASRMRSTRTARITPTAVFRRTEAATA